MRTKSCNTLSRLTPLLIAATLLCAGAAQASRPVVFKNIAESIEEQIERGQPVEVLLLLDDSEEMAAEAQEWSGDEPMHALQAEDYEDRIFDRSVRMGRLQKKIASEIEGADLQILQTYEHLPVVHARIDSDEAFDTLLNHPKVLAVGLNERFKPLLPQSLPLIAQPQAAAQGVTGAGTTIAIFDTGVDYRHPAFGSCTAPNTPAATCKVVYAADIAPDDGMLDSTGHGTNVAAIALGVAPGAKIIALDVMTHSSASAADVIKGLDWVLANRSAYNIASVNFSFGIGGFGSPLPPTDALGQAIQRVIDAGVMVVAGSGNNGIKDGISSPAAYANVVSVGAVYDSNIGNLCGGPTYPDRVTCWSNSADYLDLLAPGASVTAGGYTMNGTSMSSPHGTGAAAAMRQVFPHDKVDHLAVRLQAGPLVVDEGNGVATPRLNLLSSLSTWDKVILANKFAAGGSVTPGSGFYNQGEQVTLVAQPEVGYAFAGWKGACMGTNPQCTITMNTHKSVEAMFSVVPTPIQFGKNFGGLLGRTGEQRIYYVDVPAGLPSLMISTRGGTGDVQMLVRRGSIPSSVQRDCASLSIGNTERCTFNSPQAGRYYIALLGSRAYRNVILTARDGSLPSQLIEFAQGAYSVAEAGPSLVIPVHRIDDGGGIGDTVSVQYGTMAETATAGADYSPIGGTLTFGPNVTTHNLTIPILNDTMVEGNETFKVVLYNPNGAGLGAYPSTTVTIIDDDSNIEFDTTAVEVPEGAGGVTLNVRRVGGLGGTASANFSVVAGTAKAKADYTAVKGTLSFAPGESSKSVFVPIVDDQIVEGNETFQVVLSAPRGATLGANTAVGVTIIDDDFATIEFQSPVIEVVENIRRVTVAVIRHGAIGGPASVGYTTLDGTAVAGADYAARSGRLNFKANASSAVIQLNITNDVVLEPTEFFQVQLFDPVGGSLGAGTATVTILDDDSRFDLEPAELTVGEGGASAMLTVRRVGSLHTTATVRVTTANGTAVAKQDYLVTNITLAFPPGLETQQVFVPIVDDVLVEGAEHFFVRLSAAKGASLGNSQSVVTILDND